MLCKQFLPTNSSEKYELVGIFVAFGSGEWLQPIYRGWQLCYRNAPTTLPASRKACTLLWGKTNFLEPKGIFIDRVSVGARRNDRAQSAVGDLAGGRGVQYDRGIRLLSAEKAGGAWRAPTDQNGSGKGISPCIRGACRKYRLSLFSFRLVAFEKSKIVLKYRNIDT